MMLRTIGLISSLALGLLAGPLPVEAQQAGTVYRVGYLRPGSGPLTTNQRYIAFRQRLRELGYVEGQNLVIEYRSAERKPERRPVLAAELVRLKVDVIVTQGGSPRLIRAAQGATRTIPIVMGGVHVDPVKAGFVVSLARPGGNITRFSTFAPELSGKQLEFVKEILPNLSRLAVLGCSNEPGNAQSLKELERAAKAFGVKLQHLDVVSPKDIEIAFRAAKKGRAGAVLVLPSPVASSQRTRVVRLAVKKRLPAIYPFPQYVQVGGLMSYGPSFTDLYRRAATYVDRILKGKTPADLPVEQPTKFELAINL